jgi:hypothetical protein
MKKYSYRLNWRYLRIFNLTIKGFMKFNPPCKECLIQSMCLTEYEYATPELTMKLCEKMYNYIIIDKHFKTKFKEYGKD